MLRILLAEPLDPDAERRLMAGAEVIRPESSSIKDLTRLIGGCDALIVRSSNDVPRELLEAGRPRLRVVGVAAVGKDGIDVDAAAELGITVLNRAAAASDAVAEFTVSLLLQLLHPVSRLAQRYAAGEFAAARAQPHGRELRGLTVGIVGMGRIGSRVGRICAAGFGADVLYSDILPVGPFAFAARSVDLEAIWAKSDIITLHVPLTPQTRGLVDRDVLGRVRRGALLVNTARGAIVDSAALADALREGRLGGAALDVTEPEPLPPGHALFALENCVLTPHVAARTYAGMQGMFGIVDDVLAFLNVTDALCRS